MSIQDIQEEVMKENQIAEHLIRLLPYWHYKIERSIKQTQKHGQLSYEAYFCLLILGKHGAMKMSEIAYNLRLSRQQATQLIEKLYQYGMVDRLHDVADRRSIQIMITEKGITYLKDNPFDVSSLKEQIDERFNDEEIEAFDQALATLLQMLAKLE